MLRVLPIRISALVANPDGQALLSAYAEECSIEVIGKPNPQVEQYLRMESIGLCQVFGLFSYSLLVGFASVLTSVHPHYGKKVATVESLYVAKEWRDGLGSAKLIRAVEAYAGSSSCVAIVYSAPAGGSFEAFLNGREEYARTHSVFCRQLSVSATTELINTCSSHSIAQKVDRIKPGMDIEEVNALTEDLCAVYGSGRCPGWVKSGDGIPVFCTHERHRADCDA